MNSHQLINNTTEFARKKLKEFDGGHDWFHTERVWRLAKTIHAAEQQGDIMVIELSAILHDIADSKFHDGPETLGGEIAHEFLQKEGLDDERIIHITNIINHISFKSRHRHIPIHSIEFQIVQDADRLDAMGAIGIARAFNYGGFKNREMYNPGKPVQSYSSVDAYKKSDSPTLNHFHEKLFLLKELMNTKTGRAMAEARHDYMKEFVEKFLDEWMGNV